MMNNYIYVDSQTVVLLNGQEADVELEYNEDTDQFVVTADCSRWADDYAEFVRKYYPQDDSKPTIKEAVDDCSRISGKYSTLREINQRLEKYCNPGHRYEFRWEYEDGSPVE